MNDAIRGNQGDVARENHYIELANDVNMRDGELQKAKEKVIGRLERKYNGENPSTTSVNTPLASQGAVMEMVNEVCLGSSRTNHTDMGYNAVNEQRKQMRAHGGGVQKEVRKKMRREMWTKCSDGVAADTREPMMAGGGGGVHSFLP